MATEIRAASIRSFLPPLSFSLQTFCNTKLSHLMGDLLRHRVAISTCPHSAPSPSRGFSTRVQICSKTQAATLMLGKICKGKKKKKLESHWKTRTWLSLCWVYLRKKAEFCHCCSLWMLYPGIITRELMWFSSHNNKYSLDKAIIP